MPHRHRFGRIEVQPAERVLLVDKQPAAIGARAFDLLLALIEHRDRVVTKNELLDLVWPGLVVEENNLAVQVSALRKWLGPQAIATIPGRGYRFTLVPDDDAAALRDDTPTRDAAPSSITTRALPTSTTTLFGRDDDLAALAQWSAQHRLVTIVGAGGIGKTALALAAAQEREASSRGSVAWVELAELTDPSLVPSAVAQAIGLPASGSDDPLPPLIAALKPMQTLLVLDNAEHLLDAVARLARAVLSQTGDVRLLVTSQAALKLDGEQVFRLDALSVAEPGTPAAQALDHGAVALFVSQAQSADRHFALTDANVASVIELCRHLDGVALAIKLAAARLPLLGLQGLTTRLADRFKLLAGAGRSAPTRQQTLRAALDWSHGLLAPAEQSVFRRLGVFAGGFTLELASAVASDDTLDEWAVVEALGTLVDRSLVAVDASERPRYRLPESARDYARLQLDEAGERQRVHARHAQVLAARMDEAYEAYWSTPDTPWLDAFAPEIDNVRAALDWSTRHEPALALRLAGASSLLFMLLGLAPEARKRCAALEDLVDTDDMSSAASRFWLEHSRLYWEVSSTLMRDFALKAAQRYRDAANARGLYLALRCAAGSSALPLAQASLMLDEMAGLERAEWPARLRCQRLLAQISVLKSEGRSAETRDALEALLALAKDSGLDAIASAALSGLADAHLALADPDAALRCARELIAGRSGRRDNFVLHALAAVAQALLAQGHIGDARAAIADFIATSRSRDWEWFGVYADLFALLAAREGRAEAAARLIGHADAACQRVGARDVQMARARVEAQGIVDARLAASAVAKLMVEGSRMDPEAVCSLTLGTQG
ncbi:MAG: hypothetical protein E6H58_13485 [Betaproteobacteria bacterium]|nr:MAG: hypothetical protein E6H58_13485 [Betaproteobacteria bacterium]